MNPIKTESVFSDAPDTLGDAWAAVCEVENELAHLLHGHPLNTAAIIGTDAWLLVEDGEFMALAHAEFADGQIRNLQTRFDFALEFGDVEEGELKSYVELVQEAITHFSPTPVTVQG